MTDATIPTLRINQEKGLRVTIQLSDGMPTIRPVTDTPSIYAITNIPGATVPITQTTFGLGWWMYVNS